MRKTEAESGYTKDQILTGVVGFLSVGAMLTCFSCLLYKVVEEFTAKKEPVPAVKKLEK